MKYIQSIIVLGGLCVCALFFACGGGDGDGGGDTSGSTTLNVTEDNAQQVVALAWVGESLGDMSGISDDISPLSLSKADVSSVKGLIPAILEKVDQELYAISTGYQASGSISDNRACEFGGNGSFSLDWTGPLIPSDCSDISNLSATMIMNDCGLNTDSVMNGTVILSVSGTMCSPTAMSLAFTGFDFNCSSEQMTLHADSLLLSISEITRSQGGNYFTHARMAINGDVQGSLGEDSYTAQFRDYVQVVDTQDNDNFTLDISGSVSGGCLGGEWATIETLEPIAFTDDGSCPTAGIVRISGANEVLITYNSDGSVDVGTTHYSSCTFMNAECIAP